MYRPYTKEDKLEVGTKIRLAGREGKIILINAKGYKKHNVEFSDGFSYWLWLDRFPLLEIEDIPPPPLKIDKRVKEVLMQYAGDFQDGTNTKLYINYLNSLEEC